MIAYDQEVGVSARITAASLKEVLQAFSDATGVEIVTSGSADETISLRFEGLSPDEAIRAILGDRSSIGFYADADSGSESARLTKVWIFKGVANSRRHNLIGKRRGKRGSSSGANTFESLKRQALTDPSPGRRKRAIDALIAADEKKAKPALARALLNDKNAEVRLAALENLLWYDEEAPRQPLVKAALRDTSAEVRLLAIEERFAELAEDDPAARRVLIQALSDKNVNNRVVVVEALANVASLEEDDEDVQRALVRALSDSDERVRLAAIEPLEEMGLKKPLEKAAANDPSTRVSTAADEAASGLD